MPIRLCLFGLNADEANRKLEEIYNVWLANLPGGDQTTSVVKSTKSIILFAEYFNLCIEIELQVSSLGRLRTYVAIYLVVSSEMLTRNMSTVIP